MIIDMNRYNGGGGSGSGVTPEEVQAQIDSALTPYWDSADTKDYVDEAISGVSIDLSDYYTSAQTESAITMAVSGKADAVNIEPNVNKFYFPTWSNQGVITGINGGEFKLKTIKINNKDNAFPGYFISDLPAIYAPETSGNSGEILVSTGNGGAPVWSAVTFISSADVETQINGVLTAYTPTTNIATVNGSALTNGGNIVIEGGADMSNYYTKAEVNSAFTPVADFNELSGIVQEQQIVFSSGYNELHTQVLELSARTTDLSAYYTSAQTQQAIITAFNSATTHIEDVEEVMSTALNAFQDEIDSLSGGGDSTILSPREEFPVSASTGSVVAKVKPNIIVEWTNPTLDTNYYLGKIDIDKLYADLDSASTYNLGTFTRLNEGVEQTVKMVLWYNYEPQYSIDEWSLLVLDENVEPVPGGDFPIIDIFSLQNHLLGHFQFYYQDAEDDPDGHFEFVGGDYTQDGIGELRLYISDENGDDYTIQSGFEPELEGIDGGLLADGVYQFDGEDWKQIGESESGGDMTVLKATKESDLPQEGEMGDVVSVISPSPLTTWNTEDETTAKMHIDTSILDKLDPSQTYTIASFTSSEGPAELVMCYEGTWLARLYVNDEDYDSLFLEDEEPYIFDVPITTDLGTEEDTYAELLWLGDDYSDLGGWMLQIGLTNGEEGVWFASYEDIPDLVLTGVSTNVSQGLRVWNGEEWSDLNQNLQDQIDMIDEVIPAAIVQVNESLTGLGTVINETNSWLWELSGSVVELSANTPDLSAYYTSAQTETAITSKNYITSAATQDMVTSTSVSTIWKGTQIQYDAIVTKDPATLYIIID